MAPNPGGGALGPIENQSISSDTIGEQLVMAGYIIDGIALLILLITWSIRCHRNQGQDAKQYSLLLFSLSIALANSLAVLSFSL